MERQEPGESERSPVRKNERNRETCEVVAKIVHNADDARPAPLPGREEPSEQKKLLREQVVARYTIAELKKAQDLDSIVTSLRRLMKYPKAKLIYVPKSCREGIHAYFRQAKDRLFINGQGVLCLRRRPSDRNRFFNHSMMIITHSANPASMIGYQRIGGNACRVCQQRKNPAGPGLQSIDEMGHQGVEGGTKW